VLALNTLHCVHFREKRYAKAVLAYLNSSIALELAQHRVYGGGCGRSNRERRRSLAALLDELDEAEREGRGECVRKNLDEEVRKLLKSLT